MCLVVKSHGCHTCRLKIPVAIFKSSLLPVVDDLRGRAAGNCVVHLYMHSIILVKKLLEGLKQYIY